MEPRVYRAQLQCRRGHTACSTVEKWGVVALQVRADDDDARVGALQADEPQWSVLEGAERVCRGDEGVVGQSILGRRLVGTRTRFGEWTVHA